MRSTLTALMFTFAALSIGTDTGRNLLSETPASAKQAGFLSVWIGSMLSINVFRGASEQY